MERYHDSMIFKIRCYCENMCCFFVVDFSVAELDHELLGSIPLFCEKIERRKHLDNFNSLAIELRLEATSP